MLLNLLGRQNRPSTERLARCSIDHQPKVDVAVREIQQVLAVEGRLKLLCKDGGVLGSYSKRNVRAGITEHGVSYIRLKLMQVLMREGLRRISATAACEGSASVMHVKRVLSP